MTVLGRVAQLCPSALLAGDSFFAATPLHYLVQACGCYTRNGQEQDRDQIGTKAENVEAVGLLVDLSPAALFQADVAGMLPLHCALHVHSPSPAVVGLLLDAAEHHWAAVAARFPYAGGVLDVRSGAGSTPFQLFEKHEDATDAIADPVRKADRLEIRALLHSHQPSISPHVQ